MFERRREALGELCRVTRPGGHVLLSVMCLWGSIHEKLPGVFATDAAENARIVATGELRLGTADGSRHQCHLFRSDELRELLGATGWDLLALSASNCLSPVWGSLFDEIHADSTKWAALLDMEVEATAATGALDAGTHLIALIRRPLRTNGDSALIAAE
ncbi:MAG: hypothetical protein IT355_17635 [Gemmatimonadaceae bacterium]|nr:hypothetical protein [Gemmatimonadaceae bacterium]